MVEFVGMPRYHFHFTNGERVCSDTDGLDLPNDEAARKEAELEAYDLLNDPGEGDWSRWTIWVTDEKARHVTSVPIASRSTVVRIVAGLEQWLTSFRHYVRHT